jgi:hypothetical protein
MASHFNDSNIDFWIKNNLNVLLRGKHGVGKTARILESFERHGLKYQYFSAATMDPWVDFIGVPKEKTDENGVTYLDLVRPKVWQDDSVEAIFLDEFNRASKKVRNAVMELIQFKSINGKKFKNLKIVWAAINPEDEEINKYDVEALDPAQMDRFHAIINVEYSPDADYFRKKYAREQADIAITWWRELSPAEQNLVSPRRLDYLLDIYNRGGEIKPLVHTSINLGPLTQQLKNGPISRQLDVLFEAKDVAGARKFLNNENNFKNSIGTVVKKKHLMEFFLPVIPNEKLVVLMNEHSNVADYVFNEYDTYKPVINQIANSKTGQLAARASSVVIKYYKTSDIVETSTPWTSNASSADFDSKIQEIQQMPSNGTSLREAVYKELVSALPVNLTERQCRETLKVLENILRSTTGHTASRNMPELGRIVSHVLVKSEEAGLDWKNVVSDNKTFVFKLNEINTANKASASVAKMNQSANP